MAAPLTPKHSQLRNISFDRSITGTMNVNVDVTTSISGKPNNAKFVPTVTFTIKSENGTRLEATWVAEFWFVQDRNINESHLSHAIEFVFGEIEKFMDKNSDQFGVIKHNKQLAQRPDIQEHLHTILKQLYNSNG